MIEYANSFSLDELAQNGVSMDEACALVIHDATKAMKRHRLPQKPQFMWRKDGKDQRLGWYAGPPSMLLKRVEHEGWLFLDEQALGQGMIVPFKKKAG